MVTAWRASSVASGLQGWKWLERIPNQSLMNQKAKREAVYCEFYLTPWVNSLLLSSQFWSLQALCLSVCVWLIRCIISVQVCTINVIGNMTGYSRLRQSWCHLELLISVVKCSNVCVCSRLGQYVVPAGQRWVCVFDECWSRLGCDAPGRGERAAAWENIAVTITTARRHR